MEYPFKDLLPLDEVLEREGYYKDWTHLDPEVFYSLTQISEYIKTKGYGVDVRLLIAQLAEHFGLKTTQVVDLANLLQDKFSNLEGVTQGFMSNINSLVAQMKADKEKMEAEKDAVIANATVDSEVILARGDKGTLGQRLDETEQQTHNKFNRKNVRPIVSFLDDDGGVPAYTKLKPIAEEYGIPFTLGIITSHTLFSEENRHMLHELVDDYGFEVASHSRSHSSLSSLSYQEQDDELRLSKQDLEEAGFDVHTFVYPHGHYNADTLDIVPKYYESGFLFGASTLNDSPINTYRLGRVRFDPVNPNNALWWYKRKVDEAIRDKQWIVFATHTDTRTEVGHWLEGEQIEMLKELIEYIQSQNVEIMTCHEAFKRFENVYETLDGEYRIGVKSEVDEYVGETYTNSKVPDWYTNHRTRITRLTTDYMQSLTGADKFPTNEAGLLTTTRTDHFASQILHSRSGKTYFRTGIGNIWSHWSSTDEYVGETDTNAKKPDSYPNYSTRNTRLSTAYMQSLTGWDTFPTNEAGLLTTTRTDDYVSQTLHSRSGKIYFRTGIDNVWSQWSSTDEYVGGSDTNAKKPDSYPNYSTRNTSLSAGYMQSLTGADKFPTDEAGMLTTKRIDSYVSQTLHSQSGKTYFRTGIGNKWSQWSSTNVE